MTHLEKVIVVSSTGYTAARDEPFLRELIEARIKLFCVVGSEAEKWEEALDWLSIDNPNPTGEIIVTTSHPGESLNDVLEFARQFDPPTDRVEVIER